MPTRTEIFQSEEGLIGKEISKAEIQGEQIKIIDYRAIDSKFEKEQIAIVLAELDGEKITFITNSIMRRQLAEIKKEKFPISAKIVRYKRYWRFQEWIHL